MTASSGVWAQIQQEIGMGDDVQVMLDDHDTAACIHDHGERFQHVRDLVRV